MENRAMTPPRHVRRLAQQILNDRNKAGLLEDGVFGPKSSTAAASWVDWNFRAEPTWSRWVAAVIQKEAALRGINSGKPDAFYGPQTDDAANRILLQIAGKPDPVRPDDADLDEVSGKGSGIRCWSPSTAAFRARYGTEGQHQLLVRSPYILRLDWDLDTTLWKFSAHSSLVPRIEAAMAEILAHYGADAIRNLGLDRFGGCLNVRLKRGGSTPSVHSWGAAIDWYPTKNQLKQTRASALFAKDAYAPFLDLWERHGFMGLGRCFNYDWMHVQANP